MFTILEWSSSLAYFPDIVFSNNVPSLKQLQQLGCNLSHHFCICAETQTRLHHGHQRKSPAEGEGGNRPRFDANANSTHCFLISSSALSTGVGEEILHLKVNLFPKSTKINSRHSSRLHRNLWMMKVPIGCVQGFSHTTGKRDILTVVVCLYY